MLATPRHNQNQEEAVRIVPVFSVVMIEHACASARQSPFAAFLF